MEPVEQTKEQKALEQAQALIQAKANENANEFLNAYKELCNAHGFKMSPKITITEKGVVPDLQVLKIE